jgi:hypothetical protein
MSCIASVLMVEAISLMVCCVVGEYICPPFRETDFVARKKGRVL